MEKTMTMREFFNAVAKCEAIAQDVRDKAITELGKLDTKNASRSSKPSKTQIENAPIKEAIVKVLRESAEGMLSSEIAVAIGVSTSKASPLASQLVNEGILTVEDVKIPKVGVRKRFHIVKE